MRKIIVVLVSILFCFSALAQDFPAKSARLVNDYTGTLSSTEVAQLEQKMRAYADSTSTQVSIVLIATLNGYEIGDFAIKLAESWGIGQAKKNNGVLILAAINDRKVTIQTGYGMEGVLPDAICKRIVETSIKPAFRAGNYFAGFNQATDDIISYSKGEYKGDGAKAGAKKPIPYAALIAIAVVAFFYFAGRRRGNSKYIGSHGGGAIPFWMLMGGMGSGRSSGGGFSDFSSGGGGFGGFGGGSFGGGGASGSW